jgi:hypothetical protein|tara:strand:+ start:71 stop:415 length:345 start_codon:yes stop_codon:yes gene_type:complete
MITGRNLNEGKLEKTTQFDLDYRFVHPYLEDINPEEDFVDVEVTLKGEKYRGSVTTTKFIEGRMKDYQKTGENESGSYFCAKKMIILKRIDDQTIRKTLKDLVERDDFEEYLEQ